MTLNVMNRYRLAWAMHAVVASLILFGCGKSGPRLWPVTGRVTHQDKPMSEASIRFSNPQAGIDLIAKLDADGKYTVVTADGPGLPEGTYLVAIMPGGKNAPVGTFGITTPTPIITTSTPC